MGQAKKEQNSSRSTWLIIGGAIGVGAIYCVVVLLPLRSAVGNLNDQIQQKQQYVISTGQLPSAIESLQQDVQLAEEYRNLWLEKAGTKDHFAEALGKIHSLIEKEGLQTDRISPEPPKDMESVSSAEVSITLTGPFMGVVQFLNRVESLDEEVLVKGVSIEGYGGKDLNANNGETGLGMGDLAGDSASAASGIVTCQVTLVVFTGNNGNSDYALIED